MYGCLLPAGLLFEFRSQSATAFAAVCRNVCGANNGEVYNENKNFPEISNAGLASDGVSLESGEYFVLGDNRNNSEDSRYGDIGNINKKYIVGKVWFVISPKDKFGFLKG